MAGPANDNASPRESFSPTRACPVCGKPAAVASRPFCSKRCADVDLHRWLGEAYRVPTDEAGDGDETWRPAEP